MNIKPASRIVLATQAMLLLGLLTPGRDAKAQGVLAPRPEFSITPPAVQQYQTNNQMEVFALPEAITHPDEPPLRWGPVGFRPHVFYRLLHATALPTSGTNHVEATVQEFSPGLLFDIGNHWRLDYTPTWRFYSSKEFRDTIDHYVRLVGGTTYKAWDLGLTQIYDKSSTPLVETGTQTDQETYTTTANARYHFNSEMSADLAINQNIEDATGFSSSREWSTLDWLNYQFWPRLDAGVGAGFGYVDVESGSDMAYEQIQGRVNWRATDKLSFQLNGGLEIRQFLDGGADDVLNPVAGGVIEYQPFEATRLSLNVSHTASTSLITTTNSQSQLTESTDLTLHLYQRLFEKLHLDLEGGYHAITYDAEDPAATSREDDYYTFNVRLSCPFLKRANGAVFYQYSDYSSNTRGYTYVSSQVGFEIGYRF